ncbi:MAG TPA: arylsulfotransferase family protein, partial [Solirubrobacteraceae bacterium]|nr:arylsulfotransferase family protein [Solirubrobacteraceae bacterium]
MRTAVGAAALVAGALAAGSQAARPCAPASIDNSALLAGSVTVSPLPGSRDASTRTQISFVGVPASLLRVTSVVGSRTGGHRGRLLAYSQGDGASFVPARPFAPGERVSARAAVLRGARWVAFQDQFSIEYHDAISATPESAQPVGSAGVQSFLSRPDLHPPAVTVSASSPAVAAGDEFLAPYAGPGQAGPMILDPAGNVVWFKPLPANTSATNLAVQQYRGAPVLTWWQGDISVHGYGLGEDVIADSSYAEVAHVAAGNGLAADLHEFQLTPQGTALITAYDPQLCSLAAAGGSVNGAVTDGVLQEIDIATGLVRFQWTSVDHVALGDSYELARKSSTPSPFDFFHINSIDREPDGHLLVSARNTWAAYEIDPRTGKVVWQLGGKHTSFALARGTATAWQHDPRLLSDGEISIFDNGASPRVHHQSRGVLLSVNEAQKTATLVSQLTRPSPIVAESQGNMQALANGDWFVGWGQVSDFSEFNAAGELLFDAHLPAHVQSYRAFRFAWEATPAQPPEFAVQTEASGAKNVYASWNGATGV